MTGGGGYAAAAGDGVSPKNSAKNKKPFLPPCKIRQKQKDYFGHKTY
jgi:hypothetical protein